MNQNYSHNRFMEIAMAKATESPFDVPVGALIVQNNKIVAAASNRKEIDKDPTAHAEILAIKQACEKLGRWRLDNVSLYVTLEPCPMCATAILYSRISNIYFGAYDQLYGAFGSAINMSDYVKYYPKIIGGIEEERCSKLLKDFFEKKRNE